MQSYVRQQLFPLLGCGKTWRCVIIMIHVITGHTTTPGEGTTVTTPGEIQQSLRNGCYRKIRQ